MPTTRRIEVCIDSDAVICRFSDALHPVPGDRFAGLTALHTRKQVYGLDQRVILTHSPTLHDAQDRGL
ncbi:hypothetical protein EEB14_60020, partial [Rhodococcus sp. WS4]